MCVRPNFESADGSESYSKVSNAMSDGWRVLGGGGWVSQRYIRHPRLVSRPARTLERSGEPSIDPKALNVRCIDWQVVGGKLWLVG